MIFAIKELNFRFILHHSIMDNPSAKDLFKAYQAMEKKRMYNAEYMRKYRRVYRED